MKALCLQNDIIFLQKHWLLPFELNLLICYLVLNDDFGFIGASSVDTSIDILVGRPYGGTAILYWKCLNSVINPVKSDNFPSHSSNFESVNPRTTDVDIDGIYIYARGKS